VVGGEGHHVEAVIDEDVRGGVRVVREPGEALAVAGPELSGALLREHAFELAEGDVARAQDGPDGVELVLGGVAPR